MGPVSGRDEARYEREDHAATGAERSLHSSVSSRSAIKACETHQKPVNISVEWLADEPEVYGRERSAPHQDYNAAQVHMLAHICNWRTVIVKHVAAVQ